MLPEAQQVNVLLGRIHTLAVWHVCAPKQWVEIVLSKERKRGGKNLGALHANLSRRLVVRKGMQCRYWTHIGVSAHEIEWNHLAKLHPVQGTKALPQWAPWDAPTTLKHLEHLRRFKFLFTSSPWYSAHGMNFVCQNNLCLYCEYLLSTYGDFCGWSIQFLNAVYYRFFFKECMK